MRGARGGRAAPAAGDLVAAHEAGRPPRRPTSGTGELGAGILSLLRDGPGHGYGMVERLAQLGLDRPGTGGIYAALRRFERGGLVTSSWEHPPSGPSRRVYRLTAEGARVARAAPLPISP